MSGFESKSEPVVIEPVVSEPVVKSDIELQIGSLWEEFEKLPNRIGSGFQDLPKNIAENLEELNTNIEEMSNAAVKLSDTEKFDKIFTALGPIMANLKSSVDPKVFQEIAVSTTNETTKAFFASLEKAFLSIPVIGTGYASVSGAAKTIIPMVDGVSKIAAAVTSVIDRTLKKIDSVGMKVNGPVPKLDGPVPTQGGGAKTRRHLKKMIHHRQLIQTRTNKMIHEFMNPNHTTTKNKKYMQKKSKRRRRR
jgi:hypothetical protein